MLRLRSKLLSLSPRKMFPVISLSFSLFSLVPARCLFVANLKTREERSTELMGKDGSKMGRLLGCAFELHALLVWHAAIGSAELREFTY